MNTERNRNSNSTKTPIHQHSSTQNSSNTQSSSPKNKKTKNKNNNTNKKSKSKRKYRKKRHNKTLQRQEFLIKKFLQNRELQIQKSKLETELQIRTKQNVHLHRRVDEIKQQLGNFHYKVMKELDDVRAYNSKLSHEINLLKKNSPQFYNNMKSPNQYHDYTQPNVPNFTNIQRSHPGSQPNNIYQNHYSSTQAFFRCTPFNYQLYNNY